VLGFFGVERIRRGDADSLALLAATQKALDTSNAGRRQDLLSAADGGCRRSQRRHFCGHCWLKIWPSKRPVERPDSNVSGVSRKCCLAPTSSPTWPPNFHVKGPGFQIAPPSGTFRLMICARGALIFRHGCPADRFVNSFFPPPSVGDRGPIDVKDGGSQARVAVVTPGLVDQNH